MYCEQCKIYSNTGVTKETFCSECLEQKVVNDRNTSGFCEDCSRKLHFCAMCGDNLVSSQENITQHTSPSTNASKNIASDTTLEDLLIERQNTLPPITQATSKNKIQPITPRDALKLFATHISKYIPDEFIEAINELLIERYKIQKDNCIISAADIIIRYNEKIKNTNTELPAHFEKMFNFTSLYAEHDWTVICEQPENGTILDATFKFSAKA